MKGNQHRIWPDPGHGILLGFCSRPRTNHLVCFRVAVSLDFFCVQMLEPIMLKKMKREQTATEAWSHREAQKYDQTLRYMDSPVFHTY